MEPDHISFVLFSAKDEKKAQFFCKACEVDCKTNQVSYSETLNL